MLCPISELHFDCEKQHPLKLFSFAIDRDEPTKPNDLSAVEELLWRRPPPWYAAIKDCSRNHHWVNGEVSSRTFLEPTRVLVCVERNVHGRFSVYSDLCLGDESYQESIGCSPVVSSHFVAIPKDMQLPFTPEETRWLAERRPTPPTPQRSYMLTTSARTVLPFLLGLMPDTKPSASSLSHVKRDPIHDRNIWGIVLEFALPRKQMGSELMLVKARSCKQAPIARTADAQHLVMYDCSRFNNKVVEGDFKVIRRNETIARFSIRRPISFLHDCIAVAINTQFIVMVHSRRKVVITSLVGDLVSHFTLPPNIFTEDVIALHPFLPLIAFLGRIRFHIFDFQGQAFSQSVFVNYNGCALHAHFDIVSDSIILDTTSSLIVVPLSGLPSYPAHHGNLPRLADFDDDERITHLYNFRWKKPPAIKRKILS